MSRLGIPIIGMIATLFLSACGGDSSDTPAPTVTLDVSPASVAAYQTATLTWSSTNASTCTATGNEWAGPQPLSGSLPQSVSTPGTYIYTLKCSSSSGAAASASTTLTITPGPLAILTGALGNGVIGTPFIQTIQATGGVAPFAWKVGGGTLPHGLSLVPSTANTVTISGTPDTASQGTAFTVQISDSAHHTATQPYTVSILLQADSLVLSAASLNFGNQIVGSASGALTETLTNGASADMVINSIAITPTAANAGEFKQTATTTCGASLAPGASCEVSLTFTPGQTGPRTAVLTITDDTAGSPQQAGLSGVGLSSGPNATLASMSLVFGTQLVGTTSAVQLLGLTNNGAVALSIGNIAVSSGFAETNNCVPSLAPGATCIIGVTFTPSGSGVVSGMLSMSDDAPGSPQTVSLSGTGSAKTPLLTGACYGLCRSVKPVKSSECPAGAPSEAPVALGAGCPAGPVTVDQARLCVSDSGYFRYGRCEAQ